MTRPLTFIERVVSKCYSIQYADEWANHYMKQACEEKQKGNIVRYELQTNRELRFRKGRDLALTELEHIFREKICQE